MKRTIPVVFSALAALIVPVSAAHAATTPTATFTKTSDWGTGYEAKYTIDNPGPSAINGWKLEFDLPSGGSVGSYWDALLTKSGDHYTFTNRDYNATIAAGGSVSFGFIGSPSSAVPTGCTLNGRPCSGGGGSGDTTAPSTPDGLHVTGTTSNSISLAWNAATDDVGVAGYKVYEGSSVVASTTSTSATVSGLAANSTHTYQVTAYDAAGNESGKSAPVTATTQAGGGTSPGSMAAAPYLYFGWGSPPDPTTVMSATGVKWFTLAFVLSDGGCNPAWDGTRPLNGDDATKIAQIRAAGGDVIPSFGGWSGNKLGEHCSTPQDLAGAYQKVIDAYHLKAIDIDIENTEFESEATQDRVLQALKIVKQNNAGLKVILTFGTTTTGPNYWGTRLVQQAAALGVPIDTFTIMPFDFGGGSGNMGQLSVQASEGLHSVLKQSYPGRSDADLYAMQGISSMNGKTDQSETVTTADFQTMRSYAQQHGLSRFTFWSANRDRPCESGTGADACSGVSQQPWDYTKIVAGYGS